MTIEVNKAAGSLLTEVMNEASKLVPKASEKRIRKKNSPTTLTNKPQTKAKRRHLVEEGIQNEAIKEIRIMPARIEEAIRAVKE